MNEPKARRSRIVGRLKPDLEDEREAHKYRIVRHHGPFLPDEDIHEEDVVRPLNHRWTKRPSEEMASWKIKSRASCPTYGSCISCLASGPVGKICKFCPLGRDRMNGYVILTRPRKILDSITVAEIFGRPHETAKMDRMFGHWMECLVLFDNECLEIYSRRLYKHVNVPSFQRFLIQESQRKFMKMLEDEE
jgi:hypothetical protein